MMTHGCKRFEDLEVIIIIVDKDAQHLLKSPQAGKAHEFLLT